MSTCPSNLHSHINEYKQICTHATPKNATTHRVALRQLAQLVAGHADLLIVITNHARDASGGRARGCMVYKSAYVWVYVCGTAYTLIRRKYVRQRWNTLRAQLYLHVHVHGRTRMIESQRRGRHKEWQICALTRACLSGRAYRGRNSG